MSLPFSADFFEGEQALLFRLIFQHSSDAILIVSEDRCIDANREAVKCLGFDSKKDLIGRDVSGLFFDLSSREHDSSAVIAESPGIGSESWTRRKGVRNNGEKFYVRMYSEFVETPKPIEILFFRDITEMVAAQRNMENYRAYLAVLAEIRKDFFERKESEIIEVFCEATSLCFGLVSVDPDSGGNVFQSRRSGLLGSGVSMFSHTESDFVSLTLPFEIEGQDMENIVFLSQDISLLDESTSVYLRNLVAELSRILEYKHRWKAQQRVIREAKEAAEEAARTKARFLADMSHEIRTPLTSILGYAEVIEEMIADQHRILQACHLDTKIMDSAFETIGTIRGNGDYLVQVLNNILDFSKIEADKLVIHSEEIDLVRLLADVSSLFRAQAAAKKIDFQIQNKTPFPDRIHSDALRLRQILVNLAGNAVKFTERGGVEIDISWNGDTDDFQRGELRLDVRDSGIGISEEEQKNLFCEFGQARGDTAKYYGGTGLGLALSARLIRLLGGRIDFESRPNSGSVFSILLRQQLPKATFFLDHFDPEPSVCRRPTESKKDPPIYGPLRNYRLLLAEDGKDCQRLFQLILSKAGAEVDVADNGMEAIRLVHESLSARRPYHLVLMDMQMPILDGVQATKRLRKEGYDRPIIALTAHTLEEEKKKCLRIGCNDFITKPVLKNELLAAILKNAEWPA